MISKFGLNLHSKQRTIELTRLNLDPFPGDENWNIFNAIAEILIYYVITTNYGAKQKDKTTELKASVYLLEERKIKKIYINKKKGDFQYKTVKFVEKSVESILKNEKMPQTGVQPKRHLNMTRIEFHNHRLKMAKTKFQMEKNLISR